MALNNSAFSQTASLLARDADLPPLQDSCSLTNLATAAQAAAAAVPKSGQARVADGLGLIARNFAILSSRHHSLNPPPQDLRLLSAEHQMDHA